MKLLDVLNIKANCGMYNFCVINQSIFEWIESFSDERIYMTRATENCLKMCRTKSEKIQKEEANIKIKIDYIKYHSVVLQTSWPSGLRRNVKAVVFGRGFESHRCHWHRHFCLYFENTLFCFR